MRDDVVRPLPPQVTGIVVEVVLGGGCVPARQGGAGIQLDVDAIVGTMTGIKVKVPVVPWPVQVDHPTAGTLRFH